MVKRGIGAIVLAIIAALLLGYLLKDKSRERQEMVDMKLPGAPELNIPSLSEATEKATDSAATLIGEAKDKVAAGGSAVIASASGTFKNLTESASDGINAVTETVSDKVSATDTTAGNTANPGFSFRPPSQNEEKEIVDNIANTNSSTAASASEKAPANDTVVASANITAPKATKPFKPVLESEPEKKQIVKQVKPVSKPVSKPPVAPAKPAAPINSASNSGKYSIQLLATSSQSRANKLAETMNSEGYSAFITQTTSDNKILYRVRVGAHGDRNTALQAQEAMKRRYQKNFFVQNSLVISN